MRDKCLIMAPFFLLCLLPSFHFTVDGLTVTQQTVVNAGSPAVQDGASIAYDTGSVIISGTEYHVNVDAQTAYDLKLSLDDSWGFRSNSPSTITVTVDGFTPYPFWDADLSFVPCTLH